MAQKERLFIKLIILLDDDIIYIYIYIQINGFCAEIQGFRIQKCKTLDFSAKTFDLGDKMKRL